MPPYASSVRPRGYSRSQSQASSDEDIDVEAIRKRSTLPATIAPATSRGASVPSSIFNLIKNIVGSGVLGLPAGIAAFSDAPSAVVPGWILLIGIGTMAAYGFSLLGRLCAYTHTRSYQDAWPNPTTNWIPTLACTMVTFSLLMSYSMILSKTIPDLIQYIHPQWILPKAPALLAITLVILLPLCLLKDLKSLAPFSLVGISGIVYTTAVITGRYLQKSYDEEFATFLPHHPLDPLHSSSSFLHELSDEQLPSFGTTTRLFSTDTFLLISMVSTAFSAHYNAPKFYWSLEAPTLTKFHTVVTASFGVSTILMGIVMTFGFWTFGATSAGLILNSYAQSDLLMMLSRFAVTLSLLCGYPLCFAGLRDGVLDLMGRQQDDRSDRVLNIATGILLSIVTVLALTVQDLRLVFALKGATFGTATMYLFPSYMMAQYVRQQESIQTKLTAEQLALLRSLQREMPLILGNAVLGTIMGCIGTYRALRHNDPMHGHG